MESNLLDSLVEGVSVRVGPKHAYTMQFLASDASVRPATGWWLYDALLPMPLLLHGKRVSIKLILLMTCRYMTVFNAVWSAVQGVLADRTIVKLDKAELQKIEELDTGLGGRPAIVHGKGARTLRVRDLILGFMSFHESMCGNYLDSAGAKLRGKFKVGMNYADLLLLFITNPAPKPEVAVARTKTSTRNGTKDA
jgi:hypothetical protein